MVEMRGSHSEALPPAPCQVTLKGDLFKKVNLSRISNKCESMLKTYGSGGGRKGENVGSTKQPKKEHPQQNSSFNTGFSKNGTDYGACLYLSFAFPSKKNIAEMRMIPHLVNSL